MMCGMSGLLGATSRANDNGRARKIEKGGGGRGDEEEEGREELALGSSLTPLGLLG